MRHFFITGATGAVGSAFLKRITARQERATLLIRAETPVKAQDRLKNHVSLCGIPRHTAEHIDAACGDLYKPNLGLSRTAYEALSRTCTHIVHCAGNVHMNLPLPEARRQTLAMTQGVLGLLASSTAARKMEFVSTVGVAGHTAGEVPEDWLVHAREYRNSYEAAKAEGEDIVRAKAAAGLPITVHRPSMVVGDSRSGETISFQVFYYLCEFLSGSRSYGMLPRVRGMRLDIIPADYVAAVLDVSSTDEGAYAPILHACSGKAGSIELEELIQRVRQCFLKNGRKLPPIRTLPISIFRMVLRLMKPLLPPKQQRALAALPYFLSYLKEEQCFGNTFTRHYMKKGGFDLPDVHGYLETVLQYYVSTHRQHRTN